MANWATTTYRIFGDEKTLQNFIDVFDEWRKDEDTDEQTLCKLLGLPEDSYKGKYLRGSIYDWCTDSNDPDAPLCVFDDDNGQYVQFECEEAWAETELWKILEENLSVRVLFETQELGSAYYVSNDPDIIGKYYLDFTTDKDSFIEDNLTLEDVFRLIQYCYPDIRTMEDIERFNKEHENDYYEILLCQCESPRDNY